MDSQHFLELLKIHDLRFLWEIFVEIFIWTMNAMTSTLDQTVLMTQYLATCFEHQNQFMNQNPIQRIIAIVHLICLMDGALGEMESECLTNVSLGLQLYPRHHISYQRQRYF